MNGYQIINEALQVKDVPFIIHEHQPRSGSIHYDIRFLDPKNNKLLHSFAAPSNFLKTISNKTILVKTRDHDPRWLSLKSYRLKNIDSGNVSISVFTNKYFELDFKGKLLKGKYRLFKIKTSRDDQWILISK